MARTVKRRGLDKPPVLDVIETRRLPAICPSCANAALQVGRTTETGAVMVSCARCSWFARYRVRTPEATDGANG